MSTAIQSHISQGLLQMERHIAVLSFFVNLTHRPFFLSEQVYCKTSTKNLNKANCDLFMFHIFSILGFLS